MVVVLGPGGLMSQAPGAGLPPSLRPTSPGGSTTISGGGTSAASASAQARFKARLAAERAAAAKAAKAKAAKQKALIEKMRAEARTKIAAQQKAARIKLTRQERASVLAREELRVTAQARGRGFNKTEAQRFIKARGGSASSLRSATRKGFLSDGLKSDTGLKVRVIPSESKRKIKQEEAQAVADLLEISASRVPVRVLVTSPSGESFTIRKKGRVIVGKEAVGERLEFFDGKLVSVGEKSVVGKKITTGEVQPAPKASFTERQEREREKLRTKKQRGKKLTLEEEAILVGRTFIQGVAEFGAAIIALPSTLISVAKNPAQLKNIPSAISEGGKEFGRLLRVSPTEAFVKIGTEILLLKGTGKTLRVTGKVTGKAANKLNPFLKRVKGGNLIIKTTEGKTTLKVGGTVKKISESISKQAELAGKKVTAVSAQADRLVSFLKTKRVVRKPVPGESELSLRIRRLLKKFDDGKITKNELIKLQEEVPLLERSFFADPRGRFRPSRLGLGEAKDASLLDILSGDFTFRTPKPQILVFENVKVAKFPKNLKDVEKALKTGKTLTSSQAKRLLGFQSKKTGKFKPVGALSKEPEITLAPGEIIKKVRKRGTALINGKRVAIVEAKVIKPTTSTKKLLAKADKGKITSKELKTLRKNLKKETGFDSKISRSAKIKPRARIPKRPIGRATKGRRIVRRQTTSQRRAMLRNLERARAARRSGTVRKPARTAQARPPARPPARAGRPPRTTKPPARPKVIPRKKTIKFKKKKPTKPVQVFDVFGKSKGKFVKLNVKPLTRADALNKGAFAIDRTTARTFKITSKGKSKTPGALLKSERNYFKRQGFKLREVRIKKGRKFKLKNKFIEKVGHAIDSSGERSGLSIAKLLQQQRKKRPQRSPVRRVNNNKVIRQPPKSKRKITPAQRKVLIKRLEKARRVKKKLQRRNK